MSFSFCNSKAKRKLTIDRQLQKEMYEIDISCSRAFLLDRHLTRLLYS